MRAVAHRRREIRAPVHEPGWLRIVYCGGTVLVLAVLWSTSVFLWQRGKMFGRAK